MSEYSNLTSALFGIHQSQELQSAVREGLRALHETHPELLSTVINIPAISAVLSKEISGRKSDEMFVLLGLLLLHEGKLTECELIMESSRHFCHGTSGVELLQRAAYELRVKRALISLDAFCQRN